jgi:hypothetical protein
MQFRLATPGFCAMAALMEEKSVVLRPFSEVCSVYNTDEGSAEPQRELEKRY